MDKQEIKKIQHSLSIELAILILLFENKKDLTVFDITNKIKAIKSTDNNIEKALENLVAYGIVTVNFHKNQKILYSISEFGEYFYEKLFPNNKHVPWEELI